MTIKGQARRTVIQRRAFLKTAAIAAAGATTASRSGRAQAATQIQWISTTESAPWQTRPLREAGWRWDTLDLQIADSPTGGPMQGFGGCFNELGWTSIALLSEADREAVFAELFAPGKGASLNLCRMPVGANDFSRGWYSYDETPGDFALEHFSLANDQETLIPFIHAAKQHNPHLRLWASPWSPPSWMKKNGFYAEAVQFPGWPPNGIRPDQVGHEGEDMFLQEDRYFDAYARYFGKFIDGYRAQGIEIETVMPQNEFNSAQPFPSCTWTPEGLARFICHLGPEMQKRGVNVFFGTLERGNPDLLFRTLADPEAARWVRGAGIQWAGKDAIAVIRRQHPELTLYQSEQECGDGKNDWNYATYCWDLMRHYLSDGATGYMYWNISLLPGGVSHWGWPQNSLLTVNPTDRSYHWNHEYYLLKHASHFIQPGARRLDLDGTMEDALAFANPDGSTIVLLRNASSRERAVDLIVHGERISGLMPPDSFNTVQIGAKQN
ncbi:glycoside hydrolase family 30 protein [Silvibacterium sp.]|uniref:glycoside hydrolase family 30 protein n=1 Tax=Silvibacterium sp. TaxID=1964179 RepID=UPI0039E3D1D0